MPSLGGLGAVQDAPVTRIASSSFPSPCSLLPATLSARSSTTRAHRGSCFFSSSLVCRRRSLHFKWRWSQKPNMTTLSYSMRLCSRIACACSMFPFHWAQPSPSSSAVRCTRAPDSSWFAGSASESVLPIFARDSCTRCFVPAIQPHSNWMTSTTKCWQQWATALAKALAKALQPFPPRLLHESPAATLRRRLMLLLLRGPRPP